MSAVAGDGAPEATDLNITKNLAVWVIIGLLLMVLFNLFGGISGHG